MGCTKPKCSVLEVEPTWVVVNVLHYVHTVYKTWIDCEMHNNCGNELCQLNCKVKIGTRRVNYIKVEVVSLLRIHQVQKQTGSEGELAN